MRCGKIPKNLSKALHVCVCIRVCVCVSRGWSPNKFVYQQKLSKYLKLAGEDSLEIFKFIFCFGVLPSGKFLYTHTHTHVLARTHTHTVYSTYADVCTFPGKSQRVFYVAASCPGVHLIQTREKKPEEENNSRLSLHLRLRGLLLLY